MIEPLSLAVGAGLLLSGWVAGHIAGRRSERRRAERPRPPVCGCGHHRAMHDPETLRCAASVEVELRNDRHILAGTELRPCACRRYVGPEPVTSMWVPPAAIEGER